MVWEAYQGWVWECQIIFQVFCFSFSNQIYLEFWVTHQCSLHDQEFLVETLWLSFRANAYRHVSPAAGPGGGAGTLNLWVTVELLFKIVDLFLLFSFDFNKQLPKMDNLKLFFLPHPRLNPLQCSAFTTWESLAWILPLIFHTKK